MHITSKMGHIRVQLGQYFNKCAMNALYTFDQEREREDSCTII